MGNITLSQLRGFAQRINKELNLLEAREIPGIYEPVAFTIPTSGWGTDSSVPDFPNYYDVTVSGLTEADIVDVITAPSSAMVARAANFAPVQTYAGKFRLRCKTIPAAEIQAEYNVTDAIALTGDLSVKE